MTKRSEARFGGPFPSAALFICFGLAASAFAQGKDPARLALDDFSSFFKERSAAHGIVGASLRVASRGGAVRHTSFGLKDRGTGALTDEATIYHWASITKTMTGIAILQLRDRGRLSLDDSILKYVPELSVVHNPFGPMSAITLRQILSHTAGFRAGTWPFGGDKAWHPHEPAEWSQLVAMMPYTEVEFAPGSRYGYSNPGIVYLGRVVETLSGEPFEVYVQKNVLAPLGMTRAFFDRAPYHLRNDRSHSYTAANGQIEEARFDFDTGITAANGGLNAPLGDMERYLRFLLGEAKTKEAAGVLARASLEEMWKPLALVEASGEDRVSMGLCFFVEKRGGRTLIGHSGGQGGFISHLYLDPSARAGYVVSFNTDATGDVPVPNTRRLDAEIRDFFVSRVAPALEGAPVTP